MKVTVTIGRPHDPMRVAYVFGSGLGRAGGDDGSVHITRAPDGSCMLNIAGWMPGDREWSIDVGMVLGRAEATHLRQHLVGAGIPYRERLPEALRDRWALSWEDEARRWTERRSAD